MIGQQFCSGKWGSQSWSSSHLSMTVVLRRAPPEQGSWAVPGCEGADTDHLSPVIQTRVKSIAFFYYIFVLLKWDWDQKLAHIWPPRPAYGMRNLYFSVMSFCQFSAVYYYYQAIIKIENRVFLAIKIAINICMDRLFTSHYVRLLFWYLKNKNPPNSNLPYYSGTPADRFYHWSERSLSLYPSAGTSACGFLGYPHRAKSWITGLCFPGGPANTSSFYYSSW